MTLRTKYMLVAALLLVVAIGIFTFLSLREGEKRLRREAEVRTRLTAGVIKSGLRTLMLEGEGANFRGFLRNLVVDDLTEVTLVGSGGRVIGTNLSSSAEVVDEPPDLGELPEGSEFLVREAGEGGTRSVLWSPILNDRQCLECHEGEGPVMAWLNVEVALGDVRDALGGARKSTLVLAVVMIVLLSLGFGILTMVLVERPLDEITARIRLTGEPGELDVRTLAGRQDEIGRLARNLERMIEQHRRNREEVELCHSESLKKVEKMATIGELASAIAHEIKNPLAGISGAIQVLAEDIPEDDTRKGVIEEILSEIDRLDKAIRDLLLFARPHRPHPIRTTVAPVLERALSLFTPRAKKQGINLEIELDDDVFEPEISVDPEQIQQVFLNIMINALQAMPEGGGLEIRARLVKPDTGEASRNASADRLQVTLTDTGGGIPEHVLPNIFKPFYTTKNMGTGLGLPISRNIMENHGGSLRVETVPSSGTTFYVEFPLVSGDLAALLDDDGEGEEEEEGGKGV